MPDAFDRPTFTRLFDAVPGPIARYARASPTVSRLLAPVVNRLVPNRLVPVTVRSGPAKGIRVVINPREEKFYWAGVHEEGVQAELVRRLREGSTFWDVGAHCGFFTALAGRLVGPSGAVLAFEPNQKSCERLRRAVQLNGFEHVVVREHAVGARCGEVSLHPHERSTMWRVDASQSGGVRVWATTLDSEAQAAAAVPDVVKIDVEGAELDVLEGGTELFASQRPTAIVEFHAPEFVDRAQNLLRSTHAARHLGGSQWIFEPRGIS